MVAVYQKATISKTDISKASTVNYNARSLDAHGTGVDKEAPLKETSDKDKWEIRNKQLLQMGIRMVYDCSSLLDRPSWVSS